LTEAAAQLLQAVFQQTKAYRPWESQAKIAILAQEHSPKAKKASSPKPRKKKGTEGSEN
jgi:hypothetical protein